MKINARKVGSGKSLSATIKSLEEVVANKESPVDIKKFAYIFMDKIGGPKGFVNKVLKEYKDSESGSLARARILEIMMRLFQLATPKESFGDYGDLSDEDLKRVFKAQLAPEPTKWIDHVCI